MYLVITDTVVFPDIVFYFGVSWILYTKREDKDFEITINGKIYVIDASNAIETDRFTRSDNIHQVDYQFQTREDDTPDVIKAMKEYCGIDMKLNYAPQFRDGVNPMKDNNNGSKDKDIEG